MYYGESCAWSDISPQGDKRSNADIGLEINNILDGNTPHNVCRQGRSSGKGQDL